MNRKSIVWHIFNSSIVSGPEKAVIPNLPLLNAHHNFHSKLVFFKEERSPHANDAIEYAKSFGIEVIEISVSKPFDLKAIKTLRKLIKEDRPQLLHSHDVKAAIYTFLANSLLAQKHLSTFHGFARRGLKNKIYEYIYFAMANFFDYLVILNPLEIEKAKRRLLKTYHLKLIPNGVNKENNENFNCPRLSDPTKISIVSIGRLSVEKNHEIILKAYSKLSETIKQKIELHIIGSGPLEAKLKNLALTLKISNSIKFHGQLDFANLYLPQFNYYLLPSMTEGVSIGLLEALHAKKNLILSDIPAIRFVLPHNDMAHFFHPHHENELCLIFESIINNDKKNYDFAHKVIENKFNAEAWKKDIIKLYEHVILGHSL